MPTRWAIATWVSWLGMLGLGSALTACEVWDPNPILPLALLASMALAMVGLVASSGFRLVYGPRRDLALAGLLVGSAPAWFAAGHVLMAIRPALDRKVAPGWAARVLLPPGRALADLQARRCYPDRTRGRWVTMVARPLDDARAQVAAMDRHVDALLARLDRPATWPIVWYRGPLLGIHRCAIYDMAFGSSRGQDVRGGDGLSDLDRHEVAHCVINRLCTGQSDPPRVLMEGWAQANQGTPPADLAVAAWDDHERGRRLTLRQLVAPDWYWYSGPATYSQGATLVNHLIRAYGIEKFLELYATCQQATFEADCRAILGAGVDEIDAAAWAETEELARVAGPPTRLWFKNLKLAPGIDPAAWQAFLADYFASAERLLAPHRDVRLATAFRVRSGLPGAGPGHEERQELLRSGPLARLRRTDKWGDLAYLATPGGSIRATRDLRQPSQPWTIAEDPRASLDQAYRKTLDAIDRASTKVGEPAVHDGLILLQFPRNPRSFGLSTDYEVVELGTAIEDGHRLVTLRMRTGAGIKGRDRQDYAFVLDADDSYVARSATEDVLDQSFEARFEYDHEGGRPVFRALTGKTTHPDAPGVSTRLEVVERAFGPISPDEFAPGPFLAALEADGVVGKSTEGPSDGSIADAYWVAFVGGGTGLAVGLALAWRGRPTLGQSIP